MKSASMGTKEKHSTESAIYNFPVTKCKGANQGVTMWAEMS